VTKSNTEIKYNKTTRFLLPSLGLSDKALLEMGLVNSYLADHEYDVRWDLDGCLYLLFKPDKMDDMFEEYCKAMRRLSNFKDEYDVAEGIIMVLEIPEKYKSIIKLFKLGQYSKIDKNYVKDCIPQYINGKLSKRWKIFYKDKSLVLDLAKEFGMSETDAELYIQEVEEIPYAEEEIFRFNYEIKTDLNCKNGSYESSSS
jgi:hypothetical protein